MLYGCSSGNANCIIKPLQSIPDPEYCTSVALVANPLKNVISTNRNEAEEKEITTKEPESQKRMITKLIHFMKIV